MDFFYFSSRFNLPHSMKLKKKYENKNQCVNGGKGTNEKESRTWKLFRTTRHSPCDISLWYFISNICHHVRRWLSHLSPSRSIHRLNTYYWRAVTKPSYAFGKSESSSTKMGDNRFLHRCVLICPCAWLCMLSKYNTENIFTTKTGH